MPIIPVPWRMKQVCGFEAGLGYTARHLQKKTNNSSGSNKDKTERKKNFLKREKASNSHSTSRVG